jgi:hypothetical protein
MSNLCKCLICGISFERASRPGGPPRYCSSACKAEKNRRRAKKRNAAISIERRSSSRRCVECGSEYIRRDGFVKYCSLGCRSRAVRRRGNSKRRAAARGSECGKTADFMWIYERDSGNCGICGLPVDASLRGTYADGAPEIDHVIPLARGGHHAYYNMQIAHRSCNLAKSDKVTITDMDRASSLWSDWRLSFTQKPKPGRTRANKSGVRGVFWDKSRDRWTAKIQRDGKTTIIGRYIDRDAAVAARLQAEKEHAS